MALDFQTSEDQVPNNVTTMENEVADEDEVSDDEDRMERMEWEIEKSVAGEKEEEEDGRVRNQNHIRRGDGRLYEGQLFYNGIAFKDAVLDYALKTGRNIKQYRYDKTKLGFSCVGNEQRCQWRIYCSVSGKTNKWQVKVFKQSHSCVPNGECEMIKVPVIARLFLDKIRDEPEYMMPMKIEEIIKERRKISVSRPQCQAARIKALKWVEREYEEQFSRLRDYGLELVKSNNDSTVEIDTITNAEGQYVFNRFYVCFNIIKKSWKDSCHPLIGVDGCFLRSDMKGQILVALGRDADNRIYPIAWAVVQVENTENWLWFVKKIKSDLELNDGDGYILVSDRQKGLIKAVRLELSKIEHRMCVRHICGNLKAKHGKKTKMKPFIWNVAWSYNETEFDENMDRLKCYDIGVYEDVLKTNPRSWCRAFYKLGSFCEDVENNSTESWNSSIVKAREKPLVPMLETIRRLAMVRIAKRKIKGNSHAGKCTPYVGKFLESEHEIASTLKVLRSTNGTYEVDQSGCYYRVNMEKRTCTCRKWDITGIPCEHAYAVILVKKFQPEDYVNGWFHTAYWRKTYETGLNPVRGARFWPRGSAPLVIKPPPPDQPDEDHLDGKDQPDGKKKKKSKKEKRKKGKNESPLKKKPKQLKRIMHCKICGEAGHNSRFHKKVPQSNVNPSQPSSHICEG